jgi:hypothetical protein
LYTFAPAKLTINTNRNSKKQSKCSNFVSIIFLCISPAAWPVVFPQLGG